MLLARVSTRGNLVTSNTRMTMANGVVIGEIGSAPDPDTFVGKSQSSNVYGLTVTTSMQRTTSEDHPDLQMIGASITAILALVIFLFMAVLPKRERDNPVLEIENALKAGEFVPYYQPVVDIMNGRLRGAEVLMRWRKPDGSVLAPAAFIPLAESSGLIIEMTRHIMRAVRDELAETVCDRPFLRVGFNLSAHHFNDEGLVADMREIFEGSPLRLTQIVLEVTERQPLESLTTARRVIAALQGLGIKMAIDDVGAGHSGLSYMLKLGVDIIKIDKMFIDALGHDTNSITIIETLVDLARNMRMDIIAEGVENFEQVIALRERGIRAAQGYVFAPPLPGSSFIELVEAIDPPMESVRRKPVTSGLIALVQRKAS
jgi:sensor c-di-GMP phosphodiesterase-like protein